MAVLEEYLWLVIVGAIAAFAFGWGTGSNDVANAFGTSVGSKTLTLRQAVIIAAIFELTGALSLGKVSTSVIAGGVADIKSFANNPAAYAYGMLCALAVGAIWQGLASFVGLNVSATHSIIGGIVGFALVWDGADGVIWAEEDDSKFPPYKGVVSIFMAWVIAPILTGAASALFLFVLRVGILRRPNGYTLSFIFLPILVFGTIWVNMYFVFKKGVGSNLDWSDSKRIWVALCIAGGGAAVVAALMPAMKKHLDGLIESGDLKHIPGVEHPNGEAAALKASATAAAAAAVVEDAAEDGPVNVGCGGKACAVLKKLDGTSVDVHAVVAEDPLVAAIHERAERFEPRIEYAFRYLQVFSAICVILAHGAGEVGYMAGPLATIWDVYRKGELAKKVTPPYWIVVIGALGLVTGLATYGYNVTRTMGVKLAKLTPTRGFCAELATGFVIMIAAQYGLPTSSSQCITGAIVGIGLLEGAGGVNWWLFFQQFLSWVSTVFVVAGVVAALFAQSIYSPAAPSSCEIYSMEL